MHSSGYVVTWLESIQPLTCVPRNHTFKKGSSVHPNLNPPLFMATARRRSIRSDSSASTLTKEPGSPIPSSVEALTSIGERTDGMSSTATADGTAANGSNSGKQSNGDAKRDESRRMPTRARSASFQKGVAVLRALARAPEDEIDSGYEDEGKEGKLDKMPGPSTSSKTNGSASPTDSKDVLTEEAKQTGREKVVRESCLYSRQFP